MRGAVSLKGYLSHFPFQLVLLVSVCCLSLLVSDKFMPVAHAQLPLPTSMRPILLFIQPFFTKSVLRLIKVTLGPSVCQSVYLSISRSFMKCNLAPRGPLTKQPSQTKPNSTRLMLSSTVNWDGSGLGARGSSREDRDKMSLLTRAQRPDSPRQSQSTTLV